MIRERVKWFTAPRLEKESMDGEMRRTWDQAARSEHAWAVGSVEPVGLQVDQLLTSLGATSGSGLCIEVGCGTARMTAELARRWPEVLALDVSPEMLARAQTHDLEGVRFALISGERLDGVPDRCASTLICYGVLQHIPTRRLLRTLLAEFGRALAPDGEAIVQLPVLRSGLRPWLWRLIRSLKIRAATPHRSDFTEARAYRGARLNEHDLENALRNAGLRVQARGELPTHFKFAANATLLLVPTPATTAPPQD